MAQIVAQIGMAQIGADWDTHEVANFNCRFRPNSESWVSSSSLASADCQYSTPMTQRRGSLDAVLADDAGFVKASLEQAVDACVDYVSQNMLP